MALSSTGSTLVSIGPVYEGQRVRVEMRFRLNGVPTDPTIVQLTTKAPDGGTAVLTYPVEELTRRSLGFYEADVLVDSPGNWAFRAQASGVVDAVNELVLNVLASNVI